MKRRLQGVVHPVLGVQGCASIYLRPPSPQQLPAHREGLTLSHLLVLAAAEGEPLFLGLGSFFFPSLFDTRPNLALVAKALLAPKKNFWYKSGISN